MTSLLVPQVDHIITSFIHNFVQKELLDLDWVHGWRCGCEKILFSSISGEWNNGDLIGRARVTGMSLVSATIHLDSSATSVCCGQHDMVDQGTVRPGSS